MDTASIVEALRNEKQRIENAISALEGISTNRRTTAKVANGRRKKSRTLSAAAKKRISEAAKARWAKAKKAGKNSL
jgi:predicted nucleic acid-binding protein